MTHRQHSFHCHNPAEAKVAATTTIFFFQSFVMYSISYCLYSAQLPASNRAMHSPLPFLLNFWVGCSCFICFVVVLYHAATHHDIAHSHDMHIDGTVLQCLLHPLILRRRTSLDYIPCHCHFPFSAAICLILIRRRMESIHELFIRRLDSKSLQPFQ